MLEIKNHIKNHEYYKQRQLKSKFLTKLSDRLRFRTTYKQKFLKRIGDFIYEHASKYTDYKLPFYITQIKEKFGELRFYYDGGDPYIDGLVSLAESLSYYTCEYCGTTINVGHTKGWITTCCDKCISELQLSNWTKSEL